MAVLCQLNKGKNISQFFVIQKFGFVCASFDVYFNTKIAKFLTGWKLPNENKTYTTNALHFPGQPYNIALIIV